jgi:sortase A
MTDTEPWDTTQLRAALAHGTPEPGPTADLTAAVRRRARRTRRNRLATAATVCVLAVTTGGLTLADPFDDPAPAATPAPLVVPSGLPTPPPITELGTIRLPGAGGRALALDEGTGVETLDANRVGHYPDTAAPGQPGNFAVAGREPLRGLAVGDIVLIDVASGTYRYRIDKIEHDIPPQAVDILAPVPARSGYHRPGSYITLTSASATAPRTRSAAWGTLVPN